MLTNKEIYNLVGSIPDDVSDFYTPFARAIEAAVLAKLREQEPICEWKKADGSNYIRQDWHPNYVAKLGDKLFTHPAPIPEGYTLVPIEPTEAMVHAGQEIAHDLITANCCKSMNGLGGGKTWQEFKDGCKNIHLCEMYLNDEIDSVEAIYHAMLAARSE